MISCPRRTDAATSTNGGIVVASATVAVTRISNRTGRAVIRRIDGGREPAELGRVVVIHDETVVHTAQLAAVQHGFNSGPAPLMLRSVAREVLARPH
jgi:hypothetical protein